MSDSDEESDEAYTPPNMTSYPYHARADNTVQATAAATAARVEQALEPNTPTFTGSIFTSQESLVDNDDIWDDLQQSAGMAVKATQPGSMGPCEVRRRAEYPTWKNVYTTPLALDVDLPLVPKIITAVTLRCNEDVLVYDGQSGILPGCHEDATKWVAPEFAFQN